jgi:hypothetical protein
VVMRPLRKINDHRRMSLKIFPPPGSFVFDDITVDVDAPVLILLVQSKRPAGWRAFSMVRSSRS